MPRTKTVSDETILASVIRLVQRIGPAKLTLASAAAEVGLSASTLVQRFGSKRALLLAADQWAVERWVGGMDSIPPGGSALDRLIAGLVYTVDPATSGEEMANSVSLLQISLADPEFHESTRDGSVRLRAKIAERLDEAVASHELAPHANITALAELIEVTYHGAMIRWAIHRDGALIDSMKARFDQLLRPYLL
ncbi:DNA-binding transcriptional regulator, AcrR family [Sinosporangium album]|uniref:DNA-binding transcriptional regulator, AcrR family n=1 Tax=Sinosporangium album TaxID=504805 RepID=A0A1G8GWF8_9ACTN|nr:TetR family transcriptional regulator C-terminal domain-containing protein [Sinosporangium album]SDH98679.1 DNA-binding transcriptional regulator, AcrR family [Sinosporangium album]